MDEECHSTNEPDAPDLTRPAKSAEMPAEQHPPRMAGARFAPIGARALALAGFASLVLSDVITRTGSVTRPPH